MSRHQSYLADLMHALEQWRAYRTIETRNALTESIVRILEKTIHNVATIEADVGRLDAARHAPATTPAPIAETNPEKEDNNA